eukprot:gene22838-biopygen7236
MERLGGGPGGPAGTKLHQNLGFSTFWGCHQGAISDPDGVPTDLNTSFSGGQMTGAQLTFQSIKIEILWEVNVARNPFAFGTQAVASGSKPKEPLQKVESPQKFIFCDGELYRSAATWTRHACRLEKVARIPSLLCLARWHPIRVGYGTLVAPPESRTFEILVDLVPAGPPCKPN